MKQTLALGSYRSLFFRLSFFCLGRLVLEGDREAVAPVLGLGKVQLHAAVDVPVVSSILLHPVGDKFKYLPHAVLGHFLLRLPQFLELPNQTAKNHAQVLSFAPEGGSFFEELLLGLCAILDQKLYDFSIFIEPYLIEGKSPSGSFIGGSSSVLISTNLLALCSFLLRTVGSLSGTLSSLLSDGSSSLSIGSNC